MSMNDLPDEVAKKYSSCTFCICQNCFENCSNDTNPHYDGCHNCEDCDDYKNHTEECSMYDDEDGH